jgi:hypothetical protein
MVLREQPRFAQQDPSREDSCLQSEAPASIENLPVPESFATISSETLR